MEWAVGRDCVSGVGLLCGVRLARSVASGAFGTISCEWRFVFVVFVVDGGGDEFTGIHRLAGVDVVFLVWTRGTGAAMEEAKVVDRSRFRG